MLSIRKLIPILPCLAITISWGAAPAESPYANPQPPFFGQVRTRTEFDSKDMRDALANHPYLNTQIRTRLGFTAVPLQKVEIKVEFQDTRFMGSEVPTASTNPATASIANSKGIDLLQGYFAIEEGNFKTAIGRQKMTLGAGRFLSTLEWSPTSRAFDGWSFNYKIGEAGDLTGLSFLVRDTLTTTKDDRLILSGLHYSHQISPDLVAEGYGFYDQSRLRNTVYAGDTTQNYDLQYLGQRIAGKVGILTFEEEFIYQMGELTGSKTSLKSAAFQLATRLGVVVDNYKANVGLDMMSGDEDPKDKEIHTYRANYYFAHALYGWMDYFVNNPKYGVMDLRLDGDIGFLVGPTGSPRVTLKPQYHFFMPQSAPAGQDDAYGQEFNLEAHIGWYPKSNFVVGAALFIPGKSAYKLQPAAKLTSSAEPDQNGWFLYCMPTFNF